MTDLKQELARQAASPARRHRRRPHHHGTEGEYRRGCRCERCRLAATEARKLRKARTLLRQEVEETTARLDQVKRVEAVSGQVCELNADEWHAYVEARRARDDAERDLLKLELAIKEQMGSATVLRVNRRIVATWEAQTRSRFDTERFRKDNPRLWASYRIEQAVRVFSVKAFRSSVAKFMRL